MTKPTHTATGIPKYRACGGDSTVYLCAIRGRHLHRLDTGDVVHETSGTDGGAAKRRRSKR